MVTGFKRFLFGKQIFEKQFVLPGLQAKQSHEAHADTPLTASHSCSVMINCIRLLPAAVAAWLCIAGSIANALGVRFPQRLPVSACYTLGQVELCRGGAKCSRVPTLETMLCVSRGWLTRDTHMSSRRSRGGEQTLTTTYKEGKQLRAVPTT